MAQANDKDNEPGNSCSRKSPVGNAVRHKTNSFGKYRKKNI